MSKLLGSILAAMTLIAITYCNYRAVKESIPFWQRQINRIKGSRVVRGTKGQVTNIKDRIVHKFDRTKAV